MMRAKIQIKNNIREKSKFILKLHGKEAFLKNEEVSFVGDE